MRLAVVVVCWLVCSLAPLSALVAWDLGELEAAVSEARAAFGSWEPTEPVG